jgi:hypothetical protein
VRLRSIVCTIAISATLASGGAWAAGVTGTGNGPSQKQACDEARANARSQLPPGTKVKKYSECLCRGTANKSCSVGAEY